MYDTEPVETLKYHHEMLKDTVRVEAYLKAILQVVRKGDVVLDLGCGTGILSLFACQAGAKRVYAVEAEPVIEIAKRVIKDNGFQDSVEFMNNWSTYVELPEKVDVIMTETVGNLGFEEGILGWILDARKRFLKDDGQIIPQEIELIMAPVKYRTERDRTSTWNEDTYGLDFSSVKKIARNQFFPIRLEPSDLLSKPTSLVRVRLMDELQTRFEATHLFEIEENDVIQGLAGWFRAALTDEIEITNAPPNNVPSWWQMFFPLGEAIEVKKGAHFLLQVTLDRDGGSWSWKVKFSEDDASRQVDDEVWDFEHYTPMGEIVPPRDSQDFQIKPILTPEATLELHVLQVMDGKHSLEDIALEVMERFPGIFRNLETAREHVYSFYEDYGRIP